MIWKYSEYEALTNISKRKADITSICEGTSVF